MADNPWLGRRVLAYAHQGGAREAPSSTMFALHRAVAVGSDALELDVHRSADGHLVVCHDPTVDRTTGATGRIADLTLEQLQALDNAYWWRPGEVVDHDAGPADLPLRGRAPADRALGVATLAEVLAAFPGVLLNLDIKQTAPEVSAYEAQLAQELVAAGRTDDVIVASFSDAALDAFSAQGTGIGTSCGPRDVVALAQALATGEPIPAAVRGHVAVQVPPRFGGTDVVTAASVHAAHDAGLAVHVWTIDDEDEMARLVDLGVDGVMTDRPSALVSVLDRLGLRWRR
ncbi:MAG: glycerophosphodiester phosphodiesterase [Acidimicrobiales bacterium]